jgi:hypothetical protein
MNFTIRSLQYQIDQQLKDTVRNRQS